MRWSESGKTAPWDLQTSNVLEYLARSMVKHPRSESALAASIRKAAGTKKGALERLRERSGLSSGTFYGILGGYKAQQRPSTPTLLKLERAGVKIPAALIPSFRSAA